MSLVAVGCVRREGGVLSDERTQDVAKIVQVYKDYPSKRDSIRNIIITVDEDSIRNKILFKISYFFYKKDDWDQFRYWNKKSLKLSEKLLDTLRIAEANWDLGNFYSKKEKLDSSLFHYQKASLLYKSQGDEFHFARMLLNIGILQKNIKDYTGSEITTIRAINILKPLKAEKQLYIAYNNLGIIFNELEEYQKALEYHYKALARAETLRDNYLISNTLNNVGVVLDNSGRSSEAIIVYEKALLNQEIKEQNTELFAMLKDNHAYARFNLDMKAAHVEDFLYPLEIRERINHEAGIVVSKLHLAEFFLTENNFSLAKCYAREALKLATETNNHRDQLNSLLLLSNIDLDDSSAHLQLYIDLNSRLQKEERSVRNKFARIQFETEEFIAQNKELSQQKKWILTSSGGVISAFIFVFVLWRQRSRNKNLRLEREQQRVNEEIYNLLLDQDQKLEEGRRAEKERISRELHDGVLGNLYGIRFSLSSLNSRKDNKSVGTREELLDRLRLVEEEIRLISRDLQKNQHLEEPHYLTVLRNLLEELQDSLDFTPAMHYDEDIKWERISSKTKMNLYRILQEGLLNAHKHSRATQFSVSFNLEHNYLQMIIKDNGKGFDPKEFNKGIGVKNMESRSKMLNGKFYISSDSTGTEIKIEIPLR